jgi:flagellar biosynthesis/type III secretory pathway chaperone
MNHFQAINTQSDSLITLLTDQCADLERLLTLARQETVAAELGNFGTLLNISSERAEIGKRLETFQRQIAELRGFLGKNEDNPQQREVTERAVELASLTLEQDQKTLLLLNGIREQTGDDLRKLETGNRNTGIYLREQQKGLALNGNF